MTRAIPISSLGADVRRKLQRGQQSPDPDSERTAKRAKRAMQRQQSEERAVEFKRMCVAAGLPLPAREYWFAWEAMHRRWAFDFAWIEERVALECDGGLYVGGGHVRGKHVEETHEKMNAAATMGWRIVYCVPKRLATDATVELVRRALAAVEIPAV